MCVSHPDRLLFARRRGTHPGESGPRARRLVPGSAQTIRRPASFCPGIVSVDPFFTPKKIPGQEVPPKSLSPPATPASCKRLPCGREEGRSKKSGAGHPPGSREALGKWLWNEDFSRAFSQAWRGRSPTPGWGRGQGWAGGEAERGSLPPAEGGVSAHRRCGLPLPWSVRREREGHGSAQTVTRPCHLLLAGTPLPSWDQEESPWTHPPGTLPAPSGKDESFQTPSICSGWRQVSPGGHPAPQASSMYPPNFGRELGPASRRFQACLWLQTPQGGCCG